MTLPVPSPQPPVPLVTLPPQAGGMPPDPKAAFKAEWEALEVEQLFTCNVLTPCFPAGY